jgi:hypothetical protein
MQTIKKFLSLFICEHKELYVAEMILKGTNYDIFAHRCLRCGKLIKREMRYKGKYEYLNEDDKDIRIH